MEISYHKLWNLLDRRGIDLRRCVGMDRWPDEETYRALCENRNLPVEPLLELCRLLDCTLEDIAEFRAADGTIVLLMHRDPAVPGLFNLYSSYDGTEPADDWIARIEDPVLRRTALAERLFYAGAADEAQGVLAGLADAAMRAGNPAAAVGVWAMTAKTAVVCNDSELWRASVARIRSSGAPGETQRLALAFLGCFVRRRTYAAAYARSCVYVLPENVPEFFYILAHTGCVERMAGAKKMLSAAASRSAALEISGHVAAAIARRVEGSRTAMLDSLRQALPLIEAHDMPALLAEHWGWFENETAAAELSPWAATLERVRALSRRYYAGLNALVSTDTLTERELMIYLGIAHGLRYEEICTVLNITRNTLKTHLKHLFIKFAVSGREELEQRLAVL